MKNGQKKCCFICPCCGASFYVYGYDESDIRREVNEPLGLSLDCPKCYAFLEVQKDLTLTNLGAELVNTYKEQGLDVSESQAKNSYIEF